MGRFFRAVITADVAKLWLHSTLPALHPACSAQRMPQRLGRFSSPPFCASFNTFGGLDPVVRTWGTFVPLVRLSRFGCRVHIWIIEKPAPGELSRILSVVWWCGFGGSIIDVEIGDRNLDLPRISHLFKGCSPEASEQRRI
jgi:hypothetical protein